MKLMMEDLCGTVHYIEFATMVVDVERPPWFHGSARLKPSPVVYCTAHQSQELTPEQATAGAEGQAGRQHTAWRHFRSSKSGSTGFSSVLSSVFSASVW